MAKAVKVKHGAKDSVFTHLFSIPEYLLELYRVIHPEDTKTTVTDIKSVTCRCILADHQYNDLGFQIGDRLIVLVEAQSTWSPNIVLRLLGYWVQTLNDYFSDLGILLYESKKVSCPKPELYVVYTGNRKNVPEVLSLKELYFPNEADCDLEVRVHVLKDHDSHDIVGQYITFCKVLTDQVKKYGGERKAIEETLRICRDKKVLESYLSQREKEIMDIMTTLFDQDYVTNLRCLNHERKGERKGIEKGRKEGIKEGRKENQKDIVLHALGKGFTHEQIASLTGIPASEIEKLANEGK